MKSLKNCIRIQMVRKHLKPTHPDLYPPAEYPPASVCPMAFWEMLQSIMGYGYPPPLWTDRWKDRRVSKHYLPVVLRTWAVTIAQREHLHLYLVQPISGKKKHRSRNRKMLTGLKEQKSFWYHAPCWMITKIRLVYANQMITCTDLIC